jgi:hypothetical protein
VTFGVSELTEAEDWIITIQQFLYKLHEAKVKKATFLMDYDFLRGYNWIL